MRDNKVKRTLREGDVSVGTMMLEFNTTGIGRIAAAAGAEFAVYDMEHTGWSMETIRMLMASARAADLVPLVRVPTTQYHFLARALDVGAMGLVVPLVVNEEQAQLIVQCAKYPPAGRRGVAFSLSHDDYRGGDLGQKMAHTNDNVLLIAQIETAEGVENVEKIAAVDGIDALWIGQYDLTTSLGIPGQFHHPQFQGATRRIVDACQKHGKAAVLAVMNVEELCAGPSQGFRMLIYAADVWIYQQALRRCFQAIQESLSGKKAKVS
jgi:2-dehydro-3-deoxyglucarate aldolase/4-hydroxy-2-oxoheptanedioate aldolase